jgi:hypothetical protein
MFKHKRPQAGFGIVEALCFIVMFSMVGLIGWYVINENQNSQETLDNIGGAEVQTSPSKPTAAGDKFVFKEFRVQITLPEDLKGLSYTSSTTSSEGQQVTTLGLTTPSYESAFKKCDPDSGVDKPVFTSLYKASGQYIAENQGENQVLLKQFNDFYFGATTPSGIVCNSTTRQQFEEINTKVRSALTEAFKTATLVE